MLATVRAARICDLTASLPCCLFFLPWLCSVSIPCSFRGIVCASELYVLSHDNERPPRLVVHHLG
jgi:hypothetical protein